MTLRTVVTLAIALLAGANVARAQARARTRAAEVVRASGKIEIQRGTNAPWTTVHANDELLPGDVIRTYPSSNASLLFANALKWDLKEQSLLNLKEALAGGTGAIQVRLEQGSAVMNWTPDRRRNAPTLNVEVPGGQLGITGTEWSIKVDANGRAAVLVLEGSIAMTSDRGTVVVRENETGVLRPGEAPSSSRVLNPADRVQWIAAYLPAPRRYAASASPATRAIIESAATTFEAGDTTEALQSLDRAAVQHQDDPEIWLAWADLFLGAGDFSRARGRAEAGRTSFPPDGRFESLLARIALFEGRIDDSRTEAERAVAKDTNGVDGWLALGEWATHEGEASAARRAFTQATTLAPDDARGWFGLGHVATEREEFGAAHALLGKALTLDPTGPGYRGELGMLETLANRLDSAAAEYATALQAHPDDYVALTGRALVALKKGRDADAVDLLLRATLLEARYARAHLYLAVAYYRLGRVDDARKELKRTTAADPNDPLPYLIETEIDADYYRPADAIDAARTATRLMPRLKSLNQLANTQRGGADLGNAVAFFGLEAWADHLAQESYYPFWAGSHLFLGDQYSSPYAKSSEYTQGLLSDPTVFGGSPKFQTLLPKPATYVTTEFLTGRDRDHLAQADPSVSVNGYANGLRPIGYALTLDAPTTSRRDYLDSNGAAVLIDSHSPIQIAGSIGAAITPEWGIVATGTHTTNPTHTKWAPSVSFPELHWSDSATRVDLGTSYRSGPTSQLLLKIGTEGELADFPVNPFLPAASIDTRSADAKIRYSTLWSNRHLISVGAEAAVRRQDTRFVFDDSYDPLYDWTSGFQQQSQIAFVTDRLAVDPRLTLEGGVFLQRNVARLTIADGYEPAPAASPTETDTAFDLGPRAGLIWRFGPALLRAAYQDWTNPRGTTDTLSPIATAGIALDETLLLPGGHVRAFRSQIEWEVSPRTFVEAFGERDALEQSPVNLEFQGRFIQGSKSNALVDLRDTARDASRLNVAYGSLFEATPVVDSGTVSTFGFVVNQIMTREVSGYVEYHHAHGDAAPQSLLETGDPIDQTGRAVPFLPDHLLSVGATWVSPRRLYASVKAIYRSDRIINYVSEPDPNVNGKNHWVRPIRPADWTGEIGAAWESRDKRWAIEFNANGLLTPAINAAYSVDVKFRR